jgi:hypothetical protein
MPAQAESYRELTKANPVAKKVWSSAGDNVRHKPSGAECAIEQGTGTLTFLKTVQGTESDDVLKTSCRYDMANGASFTLEIVPAATAEKTDAMLLSFGTAARAEVGGLVGVGPGPVVTAVKAGNGQQVVPYDLAMFDVEYLFRISFWL